MRRNYWTCSKFADWLRGTKKLGSGTSKEWRDWKAGAKTKHPWRFWLAEEGLDEIQNFIYWPADRFNDIRYYINNRWVTKSHSLTANPIDIKPGEWRDVGNRFLPCMFQELVDFVEVEMAWHHVIWDDEAREKYKTPWWRTSFFRWRAWRCPEAGLAYLDWAMTLTNEDYIKEGEAIEPTPQATSAKEILELYTWWTTTYRNRPDIYDVTGWTEYCETKRNGTTDYWLDFDDEEGRRTESKEILAKINDLEAQYNNEEEEMMIKLIKVRSNLWT